MNTICPKCSYDLNEYPATIELDNVHRSLFCPVCENKVDDLKEAPESGIFYDEDSGQFVKWVPIGPEIEVVETLPQPAIGAPNALTINVRVRTRAYRDIFYEAALLFINNGQIISRQMFAPPENCRRYGIEIISRQLNAQENFIDVDFQLKGGYRNTVSLAVVCTKALSDPSGNTTDGSALKVWPRFKRSKWRDYFVYFATMDPHVAIEQMRVVGETPGDQTVIEGATPRGKLQFAPAFIEISAAVKNQTGFERKYRATFSVGLTDLKLSQPAEGKRWLLAIDFGTASTCFSYSILDNEPKLLELNDKTCTLVDGLQLEQLLAHTWFPELDGQKLLPSELLFPAKPEAVFSTQQDLLPILDYTIPPLKWRDQEEQQIATGFKWIHAVKPDGVKAHYERLQRMYLDLALRLVVAEIAEKTQGHSLIDPFNVDLIITYPLAMSEVEFRRLLNSYNEVQAVITEGTGITLAEMATVDESLAGQRGTRITEGNEFVFIDVGGGTTDMAVVEVTADERREPRFVDSMHFAGNDFLEAITTPINMKSISKASLIELERRIRLKDDRVLDKLATFGNSNVVRQEAIEALERFLDGLTEYLARTVAVQQFQNEETPAKKAMDIYLLGNGWRFISMLPQAADNGGASDIPTLVAQSMKERLGRRLNEFKQFQLIKDLPNFRIYHPTDPKTVVSYGALALYMDTPEALTQRRGEKQEKRTFLGSNIDVIATGRRDAFDWQLDVPFDLSTPPLSVYIRQSLADFEKKSVPIGQGDAVTFNELKDVNIIHQMRDPQRLRIVKSAFSVYMESWHKHWLNPRGWVK